MDIVAESLSAGTLKAKEVTVGGKRIIDWFESKLSASVTFVGVFDRITDAPKKNGAVAIVGNKDYIYLESDDEWQEFGDEGQIGAILQAIEQLSNSLSNIVVGETDPVFRSLSGTFLTNDSLETVSSDITGWVENQGYLTEEAEPAFREISGSFLTEHQSLSDYWQKAETSSATEIAAALSNIKVPPDFSTALSGKTYQYNMDFAGAITALRDVLSAMGGQIQNTL